MTGIIDPRDYGLDPGASAAVNTRALNTAADKLRAAIGGRGVTTEQYIGARMHVPPGAYHIAAKDGGHVGWDLSSIRSGRAYFDCGGAVFLADASLAGGTVVDMLGSRWFVGTLPEVRAFEQTAPPAVGLQLGRMDDFASSGEHHLRDLHVRGYFTRAAVYNGNSETSVFDHPIIFNYQRSVDSYVWIQDGRNQWIPITDLDVSSITTRNKPFNMNTFIGGALRKSGYDHAINKHGPSLGPVLWMSGCKSHLFQGTYFVGNDGASIEMMADGSGFQNVRFDQCHFETGSLHHALKLSVVDGETHWRCQGLRLEIVNSHVQESLIEIDPAVDAVVIDDLDLSVRRWLGRPTEGIFNAPEKVRATGQISLPSRLYWSDLVNFDGNIIANGKMFRKRRRTAA